MLPGIIIFEAKLDNVAGLPIRSEGRGLLWSCSTSTNSLTFCCSPSFALCSSFGPWRHWNRKNRETTITKVMETKKKFETKSVAYHRWKNTIVREIKSSTYVLETENGNNSENIARKHWVILEKKRTVQQGNHRKERVQQGKQNNSTVHWNNRTLKL